MFSTLGYVFGSRAERKHYESIREREEEMRPLVVLTSRLPLAGQLNHEARLVSGNVVISVIEEGAWPWLARTANTRGRPDSVTGNCNQETPFWKSYEV